MCNAHVFPSGSLGDILMSAMSLPEHCQSQRLHVKVGRGREGAGWGLAISHLLTIHKTNRVNITQAGD